MPTGRDCNLFCVLNVVMVKAAGLWAVPPTCLVERSRHSKHLYFLPNYTDICEKKSSSTKKIVLFMLRLVLQIYFHFKFRHSVSASSEQGFFINVSVVRNTFG